MKRTISILLMLCINYWSYSQNSLVAIVKDSLTGEPLEGATVLITGTPLAAKANAKGLIIFETMPPGLHSLSFSFAGYKTYVDTIDFPRFKNDTIIVLLQPAEMTVVTVVSTRSNRTIQNNPTRVEFINGEELEEKGNMRPGDIRMMLNESTGIQTQQISATSANSSIRIQGLDGRYTQILKDGFPLFGGFAGGLGLLQTPPLDLRQVEIIKGSSSTLYGGGAIAGLVNLISIAPKEERELRFLLNGTSARGFDANMFYGKRWKKMGLTLFASRNSNTAYDPSGTGFSAIPEFKRYVINPKLFIYFNEKAKLTIGFNTGFENRFGGDMNYIEGKGDSVHSYFERNESERFSSQVSFDYKINGNGSLQVKNSINRFNRTISIPNYVFDGHQWSTYSEIAYNLKRKKTDWVTGVNFYTDDFKEHPKDSFPKRDYQQTTVGGFIQNTWTPLQWLAVETGLRGDYVIDYGLSLLPRISALFKINPKLTSRLGGGLGYKTPTIFTEEAERQHYESILPISAQANKLERSYGVSFDVNYRTRLFDGAVGFSINQLFFFTRVHNPLLLDTLNGPVYQLTNHPGYLDSRGFETNVKLSFHDFKLYLGYTFIDAHLNEGGVLRENPLTPRHRLNNILIYEKEDKWKIGLEAYYYSKQELNDGKTGRAYWTIGAMAEKIWEHFSIFINFENITDTRQTRFDTIYTGTITNPVFRDIYAPLDGFVVNGGVKFRL